MQKDTLVCRFTTQRQTHNRSLEAVFSARSKEGGDPCEAAAALPTMRHQRSRKVTFAQRVFRRNVSPLVVVRTGL